MQTSSALVLLSIFGGATGHGSILIPLPRNSIDATLPVSSRWYIYIFFFFPLYLRAKSIIQNV